ncbi:MAG: hypothetical protein ACHQAY_09670, partial [Hyphomicrobiales bacterium]
MSKHTVPAAGGAMPDDAASDLLDVMDELARARDGVQAAIMASRALTKEDCNPLATILDDARDRLATAIAS